MKEQKLDLFLQIKDKFKTLIEKGAYLEGEFLPSVRKTADNLGVNPNTVQKAYQLLEEENYIEIIPKKGAYVKKQILSNQLISNALFDALKKYLKTHTKTETLKTIKDMMGELDND